MALAMLIAAAVLPLGANAASLGSERAQGTGGLSANWLETAWSAYKKRFVRAGRVIDDVNRISHSEGQGYAMLIAVKAGDRAAFEEIWQWTKRELYIDPSGLAAWKWDDSAASKVTDKNNASDGDILIAWALAEAAERWGSLQHREAARDIVRAVGKQNIASSPVGTILMPGRIGFSPEDHPDGQILNLSYWVFPAFERFAALDSDTDWADVQATGLKLLRESRFGPLRLPADWISIGSGRPAPAESFPAKFSYNAIRIPLYLTWAKLNQPELLRPFVGLWNNELNLGPFEVDLSSGSAQQPFGGIGFKAVIASAKCALHKQRLNEPLLKVETDSYYATTLHILSLVALQERYPECL
ncbi:glycosyl hydrolase family 8 [Microvirga sesbaniae]|uniref:glycosyl hydrolase family 8 n=1 Tax=Microvirga sesbaniae TaxID=681392 RepID=UPI0021CA1243|nr:glycosyl hydrolase family 8 [Microvirga sp. HBU67692]